MVFPADAMPVRQVQVDAFWIDETEVTVDEYSQCVMDGATCSSPSMGGNCNWGVAGRGDHPVNCVVWDQAMMYCAWAGGRLPTEAEWEKAARGDDARNFPWGNMPSPSCAHVVAEDDMGVDGCGTSATMAVGSKPMGMSPYGAHDMSGNVSEWVADWYGAGYDPLDTDNPVGPVMGTEHIGRGGAYTVPVAFADLRTYSRASSPASIYGSSGVGFRCVQDPPMPPM
ncbi:formylglycine-generating enzyme family protein [Paraliomyxa miuraensis]|nr:formylglycine-generating enzyme family protein [Paraliomyxa miuraensis]